MMAELLRKSDLKVALDAQLLRFALMLGGAFVALIAAVAAIIKFT